MKKFLVFLLFCGLGLPLHPISQKQRESIALGAVIGIWALEPLSELYAKECAARNVPESRFGFIKFCAQTCHDAWKPSSSMDRSLRCKLLAAQGFVLLPSCKVW